MTFDPGRFKELDAMVRRMGAIVSVFEVRSSTVGNKHFSAFRDLMDVYIEACSRQLKQGRDFVEDGVPLSPEDVERINGAFMQVFGRRADQLSPGD